MGKRVKNFNSSQKNWLNYFILICFIACTFLISTVPAFGIPAGTYTHGGTVTVNGVMLTKDDTDYIISIEVEVYGPETKVIEYQMGTYPNDYYTLVVNLDSDQTSGAPYAGATANIYVNYNGQKYPVEQNPITLGDGPNGQTLLNLTVTEEDKDNDGYPVSEDCDDSDNTVYPGAEEICDGKDNNCDGNIDEGVSITFYRDSDGDGWGDKNDTTTACEMPDGYAAQFGDCDDSDPNVNPEAVEVCDNVDNNCDGQIDEGAGIIYYRDSDGDGWGVESDTITACEEQNGYAAQAGDCDDSDATVYPGAPELDDGKDNDCDGTVDNNWATWYADADNDTYGDAGNSMRADSQPEGYVANDGDCDDSDNTVYPGAPELDDNKDNDCDGTVDNDWATWYADADNDTYGDPGNSMRADSQPEGYVANDGDCDDSDNTVYPGAPELDDNKDNDCDGTVDNDWATWYADADNDTYGDPGNSMRADSQPEGYVANDGDCDDSDNTVYPGAPELDDNKDNDCDGTVDNDWATWYADADNDTYGDAGNSMRADSQPEGYVANDGDCDDSDATVYPGAPELDDGKDNDCDGTVDNNWATWYADADNDTYGDPGNSMRADSQPEGYVANDGDCDDSDNTVYPGAPELDDGKDNDCDGTVDNDWATWYLDNDGDTFGDAGNSMRADSLPEGYVANDGDCDDSDATVYPGAPELDDGKDNDCDGTVDNNWATWYADADNDTYGDAGNSMRADSQPEGYVANDGDCDDSDATVYPGAPELDDGKDNDCDGTVDNNWATWYADADNDTYGDAGNSMRADSQPEGYVANDGDCDDSDATVYPGAPELDDGKDNDCDGTVDNNWATWYADADNDTYGDAGNSMRADSQPEGYVANDGDCDDNDATVYPGAPELDDGKDNDCDGTVDNNWATWYADADNDTYGDPGNSMRASDSQPEGYVANDGDCDDNDATVYPGAPELDDGKDNDCDGTVDNNWATWYADADNDTYGDPGNSMRAAEPSPKAMWPMTGTVMITMPRSIPARPSWMTARTTTVTAQ